MSKVTIHTLQKKKNSQQKITMVTAYDATFARLIDQNGIDILLVGDSLGMVVAGHSNTLPVTMEQMIYHTRCVSRGTSRGHIVADMPFMSYQTSTKDAVHNAGRLVKEGFAHAVKLEGGAMHAPLIQQLVAIGIPVMGHLGLTPQSVHQMGGFKVQGKDNQAQQQLLKDAKAIEQAGAYAIVLEGIPKTIAKQITETVSIPTIGIGAGPDCDGQVLVIYDLLGMDDTFQPKFVRKYASLSQTIGSALQSFSKDVKDGSFPSDKESFSTTANTKDNPAPSDLLYSSQGGKQP